MFHAEKALSILSYLSCILQKGMKQLNAERHSRYIDVTNRKNGAYLLFPLHRISGRKLERRSSLKAA